MNTLKVHARIKGTQRKGDCFVGFLVTKRVCNAKPCM